MSHRLCGIWSWTKWTTIILTWNDDLFLEKTIEVLNRQISKFNIRSRSVQGLHRTSTSSSPSSLDVPQFFENSSPRTAVLQDGGDEDSPVLRSPGPFDEPGPLINYGQIEGSPLRTPFYPEYLSN